MLAHDTVIINNDNQSKKKRDFHFLSWLFNIFALEYGERAIVSKSKIIMSIIIIVLVHGLLVSSSLYFKIIFIYGSVNISIIYTDVLQTVYDYCQYVVDLYFVYKYGRHISLEYFKQYENIDKILNMALYSTMRLRLMKLTGFFTFIWFISSVCDFIAWVLNFGWKVSLVYSLVYVYLFVKILTTLDFSSHVMRIEIRLRIIGDVLIDCYTNVESSTQYIGDLIFNQNWLYKDQTSKTLVAQTRLKCLKILSNDYAIAVRWLTRCYLMLTEQVVFINTMYGIRILLNSLSLLIDMVRFTNIAVRIVVGSQPIIYNSSYFPAMCSVMRLLTIIALLISLVTHCEEAYCQRQRILNIIDHLLIIKNPNEELVSTMNELRTLVQNRPIGFNAANFFQLKNSLLLSIASVVVTYSIILLQSIN